MNIERIINFETDENCFLLYSAPDEGCIIIDPGSSAALILEKAEKLGTKIRYILLTHCHYDHIEGLLDLVKETGAKVIGSANCSENIQNPITNVSRAFGSEIIANPCDRIVSDGENISLCDLKIQCIATPGHTNCGMCYLCDGHLFAGDTLFLRNVGRSDLPTGDWETLCLSIREKLYTLPEETVVHSGHGADTQIGYEKKFNFYVKA